MSSDSEHGGRVESGHHGPVAVGTDDHGNRTTGDTWPPDRGHLHTVAREFIDEEVAHPVIADHSGETRSEPGR